MYMIIVQAYNTAGVYISMHVNGTCTCTAILHFAYMYVHVHVVAILALRDSYK